MGFVHKYSGIIFFVLSYLIMIVCVILILFVRSIGSFPIIEIVLLVISVSSPTITATILAGLTGGVEQIKDLYSGFLKWKVNPMWYLAGFLLMIIPLIIAVIYILMGGETTGIEPGFTIYAFLLGLLENLVMGPLSEEPGWRGYALPQLESRFSALTSSVILSVLWACWHLPLYFIEERMPFYIFLPIVLVLSILFTWAYNNTGGSLVITVVFHFSFNFTGRFTTGALGLMPVMIFNITGSVALGIYVVLVILYFGPKRLSRKPDSELPFEITTKSEKILE